MFVHQLLSMAVYEREKREGNFNPITTSLVNQISVNFYILGKNPFHGTIEL